MKKIINGKLYDTTTAKRLGVWSNDYSWRDFNAITEELYFKRTGEFFLYGEGGANTRYAQYIGNSRCAGSKIIPLTVEEAKRWAEEHLDADEYIAIWGEPEE